MPGPLLKAMMLPVIGIWLVSLELNATLGRSALAVAPASALWANLACRSSDLRPPDFGASCGGLQSATSSTMPAPWLGIAAGFRPVAATPMRLESMNDVEP